MARKQASVVKSALIHLWANFNNIGYFGLRIDDLRKEVFVPLIGYYAKRSFEPSSHIASTPKSTLFVIRLAPDALFAIRLAPGA